MLLEICRLNGKNPPLFDSDITVPKVVAQAWTLILRQLTPLLAFISQIILQNNQVHLVP